MASKRHGSRGGMGSKGGRTRSKQSAAKDQSRFFHSAARRNSLREMTDLSAPPARLITAFGTVLYVDIASGDLRHGPIESSPANAVFLAEPSAAASGHHGYLVHDSGAARAPIVCLPDG